MHFMMAIQISEDETVAIGFSKTMQNLLCDLVLWGIIVIVNTEVGKIFGQREQLELAPKILYYCIIICLIYNFFGYLPLILFTKSLLRATTNLNPNVVDLVETLNLQTFIPAAVCNTNLAFAAYFQSLGYANEISKWNAFTTIFSTAFFLSTFYYFNWGLYSYIWSTWLVGVFQIMVTLGFYFIKISKHLRIPNFKISLPHMKYLVTETIKNGFIEYLDYFDTQILMFLSADILGRAENAAITYGISLVSTITMTCYPGIRLPYVSLTEIMSKKQVEHFKSIFWNCIMAVFVYTSIFGIPFVIFREPISNKSFKSDPDASEYLKHQMVLTIIPAVFKICIFFLLDMLKGIKRRNFAILVIVIKTAAFFGLGYFFRYLNIFNEQGMDLLFSLTFCIFIQFVVFEIYFMHVDWKKISEAVEILQ